MCFWEFQLLGSNSSKNLKLQNTLQIEREVIHSRAIRHLKAERSYFWARKNLDTMEVPMVPKKHSFDFISKKTRKFQPTNDILEKSMVPQCRVNRPFAILDQILQPEEKKTLEDVLLLGWNMTKRTPVSRSRFFMTFWSNLQFIVWK